MPGCVQCGSLLTLHDTNRIGYYQEKIWHNLTSTKYVILTVQVHGGDMSKQISFIHCSCCKICDQGDSWLLKELLKKMTFFHLFLNLFPFQKNFVQRQQCMDLLFVTPGICWLPPSNWWSLVHLLGSEDGLFFGKAGGLGKIRDFAWLSTATLICIAVSQQTWEYNIRNVANWFRDRHLSCLGLRWFILIQFWFWIETKMSRCCSDELDFPVVD